MKVKIVKAQPFLENMPNSNRKRFSYNKIQYIQLSHKIQQKNFTGFPVYLKLSCTLPDDTIDYQYARFDITAEIADFKEIVEKKSQKFDDIKKGQHIKEFVFSFTPVKKGAYLIRVESYYKPKYSHHPNQQLVQRRQGVQQTMKYQQPFQISELFVPNDKSSSLSFPLYIQHTIQSKLPEEQIQYSVSFSSDTFEYRFINDKNQFKLKNNQVFSTLLFVKPRQVKKFLHQKIQLIGQLNIKYGQKGQTKKRISFRPNEKYIFFKATTLTKSIPKKDIVDVTIRFQKNYNLNFNLGDLSIIINQSLLEGIKIVKTSRGKINLQGKLYQDVTFSLICLKSGFFHIRALSLNTSDNRVVNYVNEIILFVQNQSTDKSSVFQNTTVIEIPEQDSLI